MTAERPVRVLMLLENNAYPHDTRVRQEALALRAAGFEVTVISPKPEGEPWAETIDGVRAYRYPAPRQGTGFLGYAWEYSYSFVASAALSLQVLLRHGFDVVHTHNPPDTFFLLAGFYKLLGKRFIFDHHDLSPEMYWELFRGGGSRSVQRVLLMLERQSFRLADHVIATNESYREIAMERGGVPAERITVVRNGPDLERFTLRDAPACERADGVTLLGYLGEMGFQDGVDYLLRALGRLVRDLGREDFHCFLIGDGPARSELEELADELGLRGCVTFTGFLGGEELIGCLAAIDVGLCPEPKNDYTDRSTMVKLAEYMALAKPVVAFDLREHRHTAGEAALYATPNDELGFARCVERLMDDPDLRRRLGGCGRRRVETRFAWRHSAAALLRAYEAVLEPRKGKERAW